MFESKLVLFEQKLYIYISFFALLYLFIYFQPFVIAFSSFLKYSLSSAENLLFVYFIFLHWNKEKNKKPQIQDKHQQQALDNNASQMNKTKTKGRW